MAGDLLRPLAGYTIGITGHRRWEEQAELLARRGAHVLHGPVMETVLLDDVDATLHATRTVLVAPVDITVLSTGIGVRSWFAAAESVGLDEDLRRALNRSRLLARGPKALHAARAVGLEVTWTSPGETAEEILAEVAADVAGRRVVVQRDGGGPVVAGAIAAAGAGDVIDVPIYRWRMPSDDRPARRLLEAAARGQVDALTFTSSHAVSNAFALSADPDELARALGGPVVTVAVGPVTADALRDHGVAAVTEPRTARLGAMIHALTRVVSERSRLLSFDGATRRWQGTWLIDTAEGVTELTPGEHRLLRLLVERSPGVVAKDQLADDGVDDHAVESAIARLRGKLGPLGPGIRTVRRRGYACDLRPRPITPAA